MIQLVVNVNLLREIDERKLINFYAKNLCNSEEDISNDEKIQENLIRALDWDKNGENGLGIYCGKFESLKRNDWARLIKFVKENAIEITRLSSIPAKKRKLKDLKVILDKLEKKEQHNQERFTSENYQVSGRGKKAKSCIYEGREYKSRQECMYKEGLTKYQIWKYLKETNQI